VRTILPPWISNRYRCLSILLLAAATLVAVDGPHLEFHDGVFRIEGWQGGSEPPAAGWESVFQVFVGGSQTPMLGTYSVEENALVFRPRFPLVPGTGYHGVFPGGGFILDAKRPAQATPRTRVEHIYPSADVWPANTLKLYIYFSAPMSMGEAWQHIRLLDEHGNPVWGAFLDLDQELWDPDYKRLTVLFDPGRIKRGLVPAGQAGTPVVEGRHYTLAIDSDWHDARGVPLREKFEKTIVGGPADRTAPSPKTWRLVPPVAGTRQPLVVDFPKPMDYALLQRTLEVSGIPGGIAIDRSESEWRFTPDAPWKEGRYHLVADTMLEDISGNHLDRAFDVDLRQKTNPAPVSKKISISFAVSKTLIPY
jgi:hypothetical protein